MGDLVDMKEIQRKKKNDPNLIKWANYKQLKNGEIFPKKVAENLKLVLDKYNIKVRYNLITKEEEYVNLDHIQLDNNKFEWIRGLQLKEDLNMTVQEQNSSLGYLAGQNAFNSFTDMLKEREQNNVELVEKVFSLLELQEDVSHNKDIYFNLFVTWCVGVVKMAHNTLDLGYSSQGVLVLQGSQGIRKTTFCRLLMPNKDWFQEGQSLNPSNQDSVRKCTSKIVVELGELDGTLKSEQAELKQFITSTNDQYRLPYKVKLETYPRITSFIGTINKTQFLKDETGSRRYWVIPLEKINIKELEKIDMLDFWGAVYSMWKGGWKTYLDAKETEQLNDLNRSYNYDSEIDVMLNECFEWDAPKEKWQVLTLTEIADKLNLKEGRQRRMLRTELEKRKGDFTYKNRKSNGTQKKGIPLPPCHY